MSTALGGALAPGVGEAVEQSPPPGVLFLMRPTNAPLGTAPLTGEVYSPPAAPYEEAAPEDGRVGGRRSIKLAGIAAGLIVAAILAFCTGMEGPAMLGLVVYLAALLVAFAGLVIGIRALVRIARSPRPVGRRFTAAVIGAVIGNGIMSIGGAFLAFLATFAFSRGRQLRRFGKVLLPPVGAGGAWAKVPVQADVEEGARAGLAAQWRENGRTEHASVAAFARLTLDLVGLGAPPALVAAANRDALDEIRHTELCFSLAAALDGKSESPAPFPAAAAARTLPGTRTLGLAALAVDSLVDGALNEGVSARVIAKLARRCEVPAIQAILREIAADEGRHAAHGWDVVEWCLAEGGGAVADALRGAVLALPDRAHSELPAAAEGGGWERYGIHGRALEAEQFEQTRADLVRRVERLLGDVPARAA
jgi:hypothetical protein